MSISLVFCTYSDFADACNRVGRSIWVYDICSEVNTVHDTVKVEPPTFTITNYIGGCDVTMTTATSDAVIYYANTPEVVAGEKVANNSRVSFDRHSGYLYAQACYNGQWSTVTQIELTIPVVSTPVITFSDNRVTVSTGTADSTIYYTTDGSDPSISHGTQIAGSSGSFTLMKGTVKAVAVKNGWTNSAIAKTVVGPVYSSSIGTPAFNVKGIVGGRKVTFTSTTREGKIYYSTSGSNLTTKDKSVANGGSVTFSDFYGTIYARTYANGKWSNVSRLILKIPVVNTPTITQSGRKVTIKTTTPDCSIYYTTDGSNPSPAHGTRVNASVANISVTGGTVKAIAVRSCFTNSAIVSKTLSPVVSNTVKAPSFAVKGVVGGRKVTFTSPTPGSTIYYSTTSAITTKDSSVKNGASVVFNNFYGTIYAKAYSGGKWSGVSRLILKIPTINKPTVKYVSKLPCPAHLTPP